MFSKTIAGSIIGMILAANDVSMMGIMKNISTGLMNPIWMVLVSLVYAFQPWIFLHGLDFSSMTILNLTWDLISDVLVTATGLWYFKEQVSHIKLIGVLFAIVAIILFVYDDQMNGKSKS